MFPRIVPTGGGPSRPGPLLTMLIIYALRHVVGLGFFAWLFVSARQIDGPFYLIVAGLIMVYAGMAGYGGYRLLRQYLRSLRQTRATQTGATPHAN